MTTPVLLAFFITTMLGILLFIGIVMESLQNQEDDETQAS